MRFISIYVPSYTYQAGSAKEFWGKYWRILLLVLMLHLFVLSLWGIKPSIKSKLNDELVIDLSNPTVIPKRVLDDLRVPRSEETQSEVAPKAENLKPLIRVAPIEAPQNTDNTPMMKFNEELIKPIKPIKAEPIQEKTLPVIEVQRPEEKKVEPQSEVYFKSQVAAKSVELKQPEPKPADVFAPTLPAIVDKKNKDKDAPEVAQPNRGTDSSASTSADTIKSNASSTSGGTTSGTNNGPQSGSQSGGQPSAQSASSSNEMQAQISGGKSTFVASSNGTADADYQSPGLRNAQARYPIYARKMHQEGVVIVMADVLTDGSAAEVRIATSSGIKLLDEAALETVKQWHFTPAKREGVPYVQRLRIPVTFSLNNR